MIASLAYAKAASVLSVLYAGANVYPLWARFRDVREKALQFAAIAGGAGGSGRLRVVRALFYLAAPLVYLWTLMNAGLPVLFLAAAGSKFWLSSFFGLRTEHRLLHGGDYRTRDHVLSRLDALANVALAVLAVWLIVRRWT
jgi:hypothetical protein